MTDTICAKGVELEFARHREGAGDPILMLHEGLGSVAMWRDFPECLAARTGRQVILWSRRGYGWSDAFAAPYQPDFMHREADAIPALLDALGIERVHLFGHSDGGSIALLAAAARPDRVASLILEAPHVFVEPQTTEAIVSFGQSPELGQTLTRMTKYHRSPPEVFRQWHAIWTDPRFSDWNIEEGLETIAVPALLIQGEDDEYGTFAQLDRIAARLSQTRQLRLPGCGHSPHRDQQSAVLAATAAFLQDMADG
jgi:pimeloyl-ACP methyl ester carboxylesterase